VRRSPPSAWRNLRAALLLAAWQGAAGAALAQVTPSTVDCAAIETDRERLICYDRASGRAGEPPASRPTGSLIDTTWAFDRASPRFVISLHNQNYLLLARYTDHVNTAPYDDLVQPGQQAALDSTEAKFQISFKARLWTTDDRRWGVWAAYTQQNQWQVYNSDISRPFRETNYMPEVFASYRPGIDLGGLQWRLLNFGYVHQSNGRTDVLSRSWDRLFVEAGVERSSFVLLARVWHRLEEDASKDDNPDITDFYGHGSLTAVYKWRENSVSLMARGNLGKGKGAVQLTWMSPEVLGTLRGYVQLFSGYGESLIDYNWKQNTIGIGIAVNDLF
jgi:phospholipase A1